MRIYRNDFVRVICNFYAKYRYRLFLDRMAKLQRKLVKNGFRKIRLYDLRHTCCSLMINARNREGGPAFSPKEIMEYMGHSSIKTTMNVYAHVEEKIQREIPDKIAALISGDGQVVNTNKKAS